MIKNEKQYRITKKKLSDILEGINRIESLNKPIPAAKELILVSSIYMKQLLENEIVAYEQLRNSDSSLANERRIDDLPDLLIEYKIHSGMTQKEFSHKIGMKEQQLQRYEAEGFRSISFKNLLRILHAIGLEITVRGAIRRNPEGGQVVGS
ncbi:MAG TPA: helix-turn-helix transcriptional regulator [Puia sp.]|jgi:HTH-type transcriptional regulator/antitoxin HigA|nr:helix-turn-helix transcriptional regulator [Puia sp.]